MNSDSLQKLPMSSSDLPPVISKACADENVRRFFTEIVEALNAALPGGDTSVVRIAKEMHLTEQSFRRRLRKYADITPKAFFTAVQMENAAKLLAMRRDLSVANVATLCGFENSSSFGHKFRKIYGVAPLKYRDSQSLEP